MGITYPGTIDVFTNPSGTAKLSSPDHAVVHGDVYDVIEVIEGVMGTTTGTSVLKLVPVGQFAAPYNPAAQTYTPDASGTATLNLALGSEHRIIMPAGNITIALTGDTNAQKFIVSILQDGGGSRTVTWFSTIRWTDGVTPTLTTTASKRDTFGFIKTGAATYDGFTIGQNL